MQPPVAEDVQPALLPTITNTRSPVHPVIDFEAKFGFFPPAAKERLIAKEANTFVGNAIHLFSHHVTPVLDLKRKEILAGGKTKKKYPKTAKQLWADVERDEKEFWEHEAWRLRDALKKGMITAEKILADAGDKERWDLYAAHVEVTVASYLQVKVPEWVKSLLHPDFGAAGEESNGIEKGRGQEKDVYVEREEDKAATLDLTPAQKQQHVILGDFEKKRVDAGLHEAPPVTIDLNAEKDIPLDTLPSVFDVQTKMIYGNFAQLWPYDIIRQAEGWKQVSLLRQLADLLDAEGRILFYYYATPQLWLTRPSPVGKTISSEVHETWQFMAGSLKQEWKVESARVKKLLGDGDMEGLESLQIDGSDPVVFKLRQMTEKAIAEDKVKNART